MLITMDDLCLSYLPNFIWFDRIKEAKPDFKMIAFAIGNFKNKDNLINSMEFRGWWDKHKDWVEIGVHSYDHDGLPDGDRDNEEYWIKKALDSLKPFLPERYSYRSPGWQTTNKTIPILKKLGFSYIAYEGKIRDLKEEKIVETQVINSHLYDINSIRRIENIIVKRG